MATVPSGTEPHTSAGCLAVRCSEDADADRGYTRLVPSVLMATDERLWHPTSRLYLLYPPTWTRQL